MAPANTSPCFSSLLGKVKQTVLLVAHHLGLSAHEVYRAVFEVCNMYRLCQTAAH